MDDQSMDEATWLARASEACREVSEYSRRSRELHGQIECLEHAANDLSYAQVLIESWDVEAPEDELAAVTLRGLEERERVLRERLAESRRLRVELHENRHRV